MTVKEIFVPVGTVAGVGELSVEAHYRGEELGDEEDGESDEKGGIEFDG